MTKQSPSKEEERMPKQAAQIDPSADLLFEVAPDGAVFDGVRKAIVDQLSREYADVLAVDDVRGSVRVDTVELGATTWHVEGTVGDDDRSIHVEADVPAQEKAAGRVIKYLKKRIDARYGDAIDAERVAFAKINLRPAAWFVDARIQPTNGE